MLSPDGRCKTFDATADGHLEAADAVHVDLFNVLPGKATSAVREPVRCYSSLRQMPRREDARTWQRHIEQAPKKPFLCNALSLLQRNGVLTAQVAGVVMNQDGKSATLTAPNGPSQEELLQQALREAQLPGHALGALECHGTGTALGDPIEVGAIKAALGRNDPKAESPLPLFLAAAWKQLAAEVSFQSLRWCIREDCLHPHMSTHVMDGRSGCAQELNPHISLEHSRLSVPTSTVKLEGGVNQASPAMGVSSFGFGGTNTHARLGSDLRHEVGAC
ncbi:pikAI, partial [Symbiodinium microadriaticum]